MLQRAVERYDVVYWEATTFAEHDFPLSWYEKLGFEPIPEWLLIGGSPKAALERLTRT